MKQSAHPEDIAGVVYVAQSVTTAYMELIKWTLAWRRIRASDELEQTLTIGPKFGVALVERIEDWAITIKSHAQLVEAELKKARGPDNKEVKIMPIELRLDMPDGLGDEFQRESNNASEAVELRIKSTAK